MSLNGINPLLTNVGPLSRPTETQRPAIDRTAPRPADGGMSNALVGGSRATLKPQAQIAGNGAAQGTVPAEAPAGTDPTLWSVLTSEERNFFAKTASLGPLTYGRIKAAANAAPPSVRGGRLDVRA